MRILKGFSPVAFMILALWHCGPPAERNIAVVQGNLKDHPESRLVLNELDIKDITPVDSTITGPGGNFKIEFGSESPSIYALEVDNNFITLIIHAGDTLIVKDTNGRFTVSGSFHSRIFNEYEQQTRKNLQKIDSLGKIFTESKNDPGFFAIRSLLEQAYTDILNEQKLLARKFIDRYPSSLASLVVLNRRFGNELLFDEKNDFEYFLKIDSGLMETYPDNKHTLDHHRRVSFFEREMEERKRAIAMLKPGRKSPDLDLQGTDGSFYRLSENAGNITILYFWAPEDGRSRLGNKKLQDIHDDFREEGLEVYAVSLGQNKDIWVAAIRLDSLHWINVSDLKGYGSPVKKLFRVPDRLPYFYVLDREMTILGRGHDLDSVRSIISGKLD